MSSSSSSTRNLQVHLLEARGLHTLQPHKLRLRLQLVWPEDRLGETFGVKVTPWTDTVVQSASRSTSTTTTITWRPVGCQFPVDSQLLLSSGRNMVIRVTLQVLLAPAGTRAKSSGSFFTRALPSSSQEDQIADLATMEVSDFYGPVFEQYQGAMSRDLFFDDDVCFKLVLKDGSAGSSKRPLSKSGEVGDNRIAPRSAGPAPAPASASTATSVAGPP
ncbi:unnamed protein product, partial [Amoebophrya sp. A120]|eukprot:GSA120T00021849001.1